VVPVVKRGQVGPITEDTGRAARGSAWKERKGFPAAESLHKKEEEKAKGKRTGG
jgi:hypothetical protein